MAKKILELKILCVPIDDKIIDLRHKILRPGRPRTSASFDYDEDGNTFHFVAYIPENPIAPVCCVTYVLNSWGNTVAYQLRGMATDSSFQNMGIGKKLLAFAEEYIKEKLGITAFWCKARTGAVGFYESQGWVCYGKEFNIKDVGPHIKMTKGIAPFS
jgi:GNAT superfamily N-acetyltransferase